MFRYAKMIKDFQKSKKKSMINSIFSVPHKIDVFNRQKVAFKGLKSFQQKSAQRF